MWVRRDEYKVVGEVLAGVRRRAAVNQLELSSRLGKPQSFVSSYETGQRRIDLVEFLRIADALGVNPRNVFDHILRRLTKASAGKRPPS